MASVALADALPEGRSVFLDAAVVKAYLGMPGPLSSVAEELMDGMVQSGRNPAFLSAITAMDLLAAPARLSDGLLTAQLTDFLAYFPNLTVCAVDFDTALNAAQLGAAWALAPADAMILAGAVTSGADCLVTADPGWRARLGGGAPVPLVFLADHAAGP